MVRIKYRSVKFGEMVNILYQNMPQSSRCGAHTQLLKHFLHIFHFLLALNLFRGAEYQRFYWATNKEPLTYYDMNLSPQDHQAFFTCESRFYQEINPQIFNYWVNWWYLWSNIHSLDFIRNQQTDLFKDLFLTTKFDPIVRPCWQSRIWNDANGLAWKESGCSNWSRSQCTGNEFRVFTITI